jgi:hypothetical protein
VFELGHRRSHERLLRLAPGGDRPADQLAGLCGQTGQDRREINDDLPEEVEPHGADILHGLRVRGVFGELPGLFSVDVGIRPVGELHDQPHGAGVVAVLVGGGDLTARGGALGEQSAVVGVGCGKTSGVEEFCGAAGEVDHLADEVGIDFVDELFGVQVEIVQAGAEFAGIEIA